MSRILDFSDGFTSATEPDAGIITANNIAVFASDAAFVTAKGSAAAEGDLYHRNTDDKIRYYTGAAWTSLVNEDAAATLTNKSIDSDTNTLSNIKNADIKAAAAIALNKLAAVTASKALVSDGSGFVSASSVTSTELGYVSGVTSAIQTQINTKAPSASPTFTGTVTTPLTASRALATGPSSELAVSATTATELGYVNGVTSAIQTQLDAKVPKTLTTTTGDMIYASGANTPARLPVGSAGQVLKTVAGLPTWANFSGGINYITATDGTEIGSWTTYADAAATSPVDGTGGSPASTYAVSTDSSLRGTTNFLFTHSAANRQGEGFSYNFTIDPSDKGKVLQISCEYKIASGTYADDDLQFWVYDVTNAALIPVTPFKLKNSGIIEKFAMEFQTSSSSTSYRLIGHVATTTATAYTIRFGNWNLGPQAKLYGSAVTDVVSYTPTLSNATNATVNMSTYSRVGDKLKINGLITWAGAGGGSTFTVSLPSGLTIDTAKIKNNVESSLLGTALWQDSGTAFKTVAVEYSSTTVVQFEEVTSSTGVLVGTGFASGDTLSYYFEVPIVGWSSSQVMSSDADTRVVTMQVSGNVTATVTGSYSLLKFTSTPYKDTHGSFSTSTGLYTVPVSGFYECTAQVQINGTYANTQISAIGIAQNGSLGNIGVEVAGTGGTTLYPSVTSTIYCNAGDTLAPYVTSQSTTPTAVSSVNVSWFNVTRLSGPAQIAASEEMSAIYSTVNTTVTNGNSNVTVIPFTARTFDSHSAYNTTTGVYTVQSAGRFRVDANIYCAPASGNWAIAIFQNGTIKSYGNIGSGIQSQTFALLNCLAGDTIDIRGTQNSGSGNCTFGLSSTSRDQLSIIKVK